MSLSAISASSACTPKLLPNTWWNTVSQPSKSTPNDQQQVETALREADAEAEYWRNVTLQKPQIALDYKLYLEEFGEDAQFAPLARLQIARLKKRDSSRKESSGRMRTVIRLSGAFMVLYFVVMGWLFRSQLGAWFPDHDSKPPEPTQGSGTGEFSALANKRVVLVTSGQQVPGTLGNKLLEAGVELDIVGVNNIGDIGIRKPALIIIAANTKDLWATLSTSAVRRLFADLPVLGMGSGGAKLFQALGATIGIGKVMHSPGNHDIQLELPNIFPGQSAGSHTVTIYKKASRSDVLGVYDNGSPAVAGFEGIARWTEHARHWPVARQGNLLLWGFDAPLANLSDNGRKLLASLIEEHAGNEHRPYAELTPEVTLSGPGSHRDRLDAIFKRGTFHFNVQTPGKVTAQATWSPPDKSLALTLNGPGQVGYTKRVDGRSPLSLEFEIAPDQIRVGEPWRLNLTRHGAISAGDSIAFELKLAYPQ